MFYAVPPTIPPSGQFNQLSVTNRWRVDALTISRLDLD